MPRHASLIHLPVTILGRHDIAVVEVPILPIVGLISRLISFVYPRIISRQRAWAGIKQRGDPQFKSGSGNYRVAKTMYRLATKKGATIYRNILIDMWFRVGLDWIQGPDSASSCRWREIDHRPMTMVLLRPKVLL